MGEWLPVHLRIKHLSSAFSVDVELTMINSNPPHLHDPRLHRHKWSYRIIQPIGQSMIADEPDSCPSSVVARL